MNVKQFLIKITMIGLLGPATTFASTELKILADRPPETLNPRHTLDGNSQRISRLLYRALTVLDTQQEPKPDLASKFFSTDNNKIWHFEVPAQGDRIYQCLENYRTLTPKARILGGFSGWIQTEFKPAKNPKQFDTITFHLKEPDPYFPRNVTLLRYYEVQNQPSPCVEVQDESLIRSSGEFEIQERSTKQLFLTPKNPKSELNALRFIFIRDETARTLALLRDQGDIIQNNLPLTKANWIQKKHSDRFESLLWNGVNVSYLAFNVKDPMLQNLNIRRAIALALNTQEYIQYKLYKSAEPTSELLAPSNEEYSGLALITHSAIEANRLLDESGFKRNPKTGVRFELRYRTTPVREGMDLAKWVQISLKEIGIDLKIETVEPGVFLTSIRKGKFQLYSSRWIGVADASILLRTLHSKQNLNRWGYHSESMNQLLEKLLILNSLKERKEQTRLIQEQVLKDLPFLPIFRWKNGMILSKKWRLPSAETLSVSGDFYPLALLKLTDPKPPNL